MIDTEIGEEDPIRGAEKAGGAEIDEIEGTVLDPEARTAIDIGIETVTEIEIDGKEETDTLDRELLNLKNKGRKEACRRRMDHVMLLEAWS